MKQFLRSNVAWVFEYFDHNKSLLEIFSFLMVAQSFIYSSDLKGVSQQSVSAFKIVLWAMIFLIILLLQISTAVEIRKGEVSNTLFAGANFMKTVMRLLTLVLLIAAVPIFIRQIQESIHNRLFSVFYVSLALIIFFEVTAFVATRSSRQSRRAQAGNHK